MNLVVKACALDEQGAGGRESDRAFDTTTDDTHGIAST
jgi:hypothetical protein